jgi:peptidoglycan/xylan/chitin deacetylase (PgdA/CDA1 family)
MQRLRPALVAVLAAVLGAAALPRLLSAAQKAPPAPANPARRTVAVTVDDLPFVGYGLPLGEVKPLSRALVAALAARKVPAVAFVNEDKVFVSGEVDARIALLEEWLDAGMELGNHTWGHTGLTRTPLPAMQDAVVRGETVTRWLLEKRGRTLKWFRHPYTHTGTTREIKDAFEAFLSGRGYTVAPFTSTRTGSSRRPTRSSLRTATRQGKPASSRPTSRTSTRAAPSTRNAREPSSAAKSPRSS